MSKYQRRRAAAIDLLPVPYALAIRLRDEGVDEATIAARVGIEPEAWGNFLAIAMAKLSAVECPEEPSKG
ncbi:hypothetical protein ACFWUP_02680 [Nocardia sp. NPDC058658]|uniref:hypothetical protein n=1 Tax=Nocardia sp. NPDC058658 TaxID=3346580 RepID=UPI00365E4A6D